MIFLLVGFFSAVLLSIGIILIRVPFYRMAERTLSLLNTLIDTEDDELVKQKKLIKKLTAELVALGIFLLSAAFVLFVSIIPIFIYEKLSEIDYSQLNSSSWQFMTAFILGSILPFVVYSFINKKKDYSEWSQLLHRMVLDNPNISKFLFAREKSTFKKRLEGVNENFVIISGLARAGTTSLTTQLFETGRFSSLDYSNMPFLLCPGLWRKVYKPKTDELKERSHGDKVMFGYDTVEALEEYFFKAYLNDSFIEDNCLKTHNVSEEVYQEYLKYQSLIKADKTDNQYLAKNNNLLLRYESLRQQNPSFKAIFLFRNPVEHAYSLMKQHKRYTQLQQQDGFVLEYMNWLCHHEFGLNHKRFAFSGSIENPTHEMDSINYWLEVWVNYYTELLKHDDQNLYLIQYQDYAQKPNEVLSKLSEIIGLDYFSLKRESFENLAKFYGETDPVLFEKASTLYNQLRQRKVTT